MDLDTVVNGLAHELWAMSQGRAPIEDVVTPMMAELLSFAAAVRGAEREACALEADHWQLISGSTHKCGEYIAAAIRGRSTVPTEPTPPTLA